MARKMQTMDGNHAAAHASYAYTDVAAIYPITPSSVMAEATDEWATQGKENIFGQTVQVTEMQSEAGAAGTVHGSLAAGALTTTYTASQGLLLMIPNLYKIAGEGLPGVFNVSARTISSHALCIFGDHSDVYACRQTGAAMLCESSVQEVMDLTPVAHLAAIKGKLPFINFFDGFRTSHEVQKIETWDYEDLKDMADLEAINDFRRNALNPEHPCQMGSAQNPDIFFQTREACNSKYEKMADIVQSYMDKVNEKIGTNYKLFNYYGAEDAEHVIIAMGSVCEAAEEIIDYMNANGGKVGIVKVRLYRPFSDKALIEAIPDSVKQISVLDRSKEPGAGEPLYLDVAAALRGSKFKDVPIFHGRYGLGSKDTTPAQLMAVYKNTEKEVFTIGIVDDVTNLSLDIKENPNTASDSTISCKFWGLGADGTVGANKNSIKIIGDNTDMYAQAYFDYDSKKSGGVTISHLRFGKEPIRSTYLINMANFVACHNPAYIHKFNMVEDIVDGGTFLLNCPWNKDELEENIPSRVKKYIAEHNINFYTIDGIKIGKDIGLGGRINTVLQSAFFKLAKIIPEEEAIDLMKKAAKASYGRKGDAVVQMNYDAIEAGAKQVVKVDIPDSWKDAKDEPIAEDRKAEGRKEAVDFVNVIQKAVNSQAGNLLKVSEVAPYEDGRTPSGTSAFEKRGVAVDIPVWDPEKCIQCNFCSYVCPHAVIRPVAMTSDEASNAPSTMKSIPMTGFKDEYSFSVTVSVLDCLGCGSCINVCPGKKGDKALSFAPLEHNHELQDNFDYGIKLPKKADVLDKFKADSVKGSQFRQPLLEFSGACAGCGETPYVKLITQLFGDRMYIANATGCSSIWGNSSPSTPYTVNDEGRGPAWSNSLFEDAAEFGYGMLLGQRAMRDSLKARVEKLLETASKDFVKEAAKEYLDTFNSGALNGPATEKLVDALEKCGCENAQGILKDKDMLAKKSQWIIGGDGWAYDIGFGGLDHVLASGRDINILVLDTEVYSNTGGQASKSTPTGAIAQFAAGGKEVKKKNLAEIAMSYGYVYVAQVAMGADYAQCVKAFSEAENYPGPSIVICYAPCINHGIKAGMAKSQTEEKNAVEAGYWHLFRFNPELAEKGESAFIVDSKAPTSDYKEFLNGEVRYNSLMRANPEKAERLFNASEQQAKDKYEHILKLVDLYGAAK